VSQQFSLFDVDAPNKIKREALRFRPANMRTVHGIRCDVFNDDGEHREGHSYSVSCVQCVEETLVDGQFVRISGGGLDAPNDIPLGSVKTTFDWDGVTRTGLCQRTYERKGA
jgi:hypothetical protein